MTQEMALLSRSGEGPELGVGHGEVGTDQNPLNDSLGVSQSIEERTWPFVGSGLSEFANRIDDAIRTIEAGGDPRNHLHVVFHLYPVIESRIDLSGVGDQRISDRSLEVLAEAYQRYEDHYNDGPQIDSAEQQQLVTDLRYTLREDLSLRSTMFPKPQEFPANLQVAEAL